MQAIPLNHTDEQLAFMMDDTAEWVVSAEVGTASYRVASLRMAVEGVAALAATGRTATAVVWDAPGDIVIYPEQLQRLAKLLTSHEWALPDTEFARPRVAARMASRDGARDTRPMRAHTGGDTCGTGDTDPM
jgi:hypothetical protein